MFGMVCWRRGRLCLEWCVENRERLCLEWCIGEGEDHVWNGMLEEGRAMFGMVCWRRESYVWNGVLE